MLTEDEIIEIRQMLKDLSLHIVNDEFEQYDENEDDSTEIRPTNHAPVLIADSGGISFENLKWGFKRFNHSGVIINARVETVKIKGTFSKLVEAGRCVVPAGEFFEWNRIGNEKGKKVTGKKHHIKDKDGNLLFMAGLYRYAVDEKKADASGEALRQKAPGVVKEFVIITKEATGEMMKIHDRMPVILRKDQVEPWLRGKVTIEDIEKLVYDASAIPCGVEDKDFDIIGGEQLTLF